jgi:Gas vesicle synthesis protein GvpL/GvpF
MAARTKSRRERKPARARHACYVYGIVPHDVEPAGGKTGVGDPPGELSLVRYKDIAALVSDVITSEPLGRPEDLLAHEGLLDGAATAAVPVIPFRFGTVLTSKDAVLEDLLAPHHDTFAAALRELDGHVQYVVKGRYGEQAALAEVLAEQPEAARLRAEIAAIGEPDATRAQRIRLGELIAGAIGAKREADTRALGDAVAQDCTAIIVREPSHELDAVHLALLAKVSRRRAIERAVRQLGRDWAGRVELRLVGPMAPYDFVATLVPES